MNTSQILHEFGMKYELDYQLRNAALARDVEVLHFMFDSSLWDEHSVMKALIKGGHTNLLNYMVAKSMIKLPLTLRSKDKCKGLKMWKAYDWMSSHGVKIDRSIKKNELMNAGYKINAQVIEFWMSQDGIMSIEQRKKAMRAGQGPKLIEKYLEFLRSSNAPQKKRGNKIQGNSNK